MMKLDSYQREALIQQVLDAHHFVPGRTVDRRLIRAMAADLRAAFERAGARWDEVAQFAVLFLENWRRHPRLSAEEISMTEKAFREGFGLLN